MAIKVLTIHNRIHLGGPIYIIAFLSKYLAPEYETKLIMGPVLPDEISAEHLFQELDVPYKIVDEMRRSVNPLLDIKSFFKVRKLIKQYKPVIVHTHTAKAGAIGRLAAWSCGVPIIIHTFHGHVFHSYFSGPVTWMVKVVERLFAKLSTAIIAISDVQKVELGQTYKIASLNKIHVVPLGLDLDKFSSATDLNRIQFRDTYELKNEEVAFALIGRFAPIKNHHFLFDTIYALKQKSPESFEKSVFFVIGDGDMKSEFQQKLVKYEIPYSEKQKNFNGGGVVFTSWIKNIHEILTGLDAVLLTSHNEGTPLSLIEAQAAGLPVISTNVGGVSDVVIHEKTGIIVPPGDCEAFSKSILRFITNTDERLEMGKAAQIWVRSKFSYQRLIANTKELYAILLKNAKQ